MTNSPSSSNAAQAPYNTIYDAIGGSLGGSGIATSAQARDCCASRPDGRAMLKQIIHESENESARRQEEANKLRRSANHLYILSAALPAVLTPEQDEALFYIAIELGGE